MTVADGSRHRCSKWASIWGTSSSRSARWPIHHASQRREMPSHSVSMPSGNDSSTPAHSTQWLLPFITSKMPLTVNSTATKIHKKYNLAKTSPKTKPKVKPTNTSSHMWISACTTVHNTAQIILSLDLQMNITALMLFLEGRRAWWKLVKTQ